MEAIKRELERFHNKDFRVDVAVGHVLRIYKDVMKVIENKENPKKNTINIMVYLRRNNLLLNSN